MQSLPKFEELIPNDLTKFAYQTFQEGKKLFGVAHKTISDRLTDLAVNDNRPKAQPLSPEILLKLQSKIKELEEADWQDVQAGVYPAQTLFDNPWQDFFRYYPEVWLDMPKIWARLQNRVYQEFDTKIERDGYLG